MIDSCLRHIFYRTVPPAVFGQIKCVVCLAQETLEVRIIFYVPGGIPDADRERLPGTGGFNPEIFCILPEGICQFIGLLWRQLCVQTEKFFPAEAEDIPSCIPKSTGYGFQALVALQMAEGVIILFEIINIRYEKCSVVCSTG